MGTPQACYNPIHYLALLERKPGGFNFAKPLENWELPASFATLRRRMESKPEGLGSASSFVYCGSSSELRSRN